MWWLSHVVEGWMFTGRQGIHRSCTLWLMCVPWQQCHEEETDVYWEQQKEGNQFFTMFHLFSSFCYLERGMSAVLHRKCTMTHCFIDFRWRRPVDIPGWQPYTAVPTVKGRAFNWLQVHQYTHHLLKWWTEWHLFIGPLYSQWHSQYYTKDYYIAQICFLLRHNHCRAHYVT